MLGVESVVCVEIVFWPILLLSNLCTVGSKKLTDEFVENSVAYIEIMFHMISGIVGSFSQNKHADDYVETSSVA